MNFIAARKLPLLEGLVDENISPFCMNYIDYNFMHHHLIPSTQPLVNISV